MSLQAEAGAKHTQLLVMIWIILVLSITFGPMMKNGFKVLVALVGACISSYSYCQYYFTDIVSHQQSETQYSLLLAAKVKEVKATGYDERGEKSDNFGIEQTISDGGKTMVTKTVLPNSSATILENTYDSGKLKTSINSSLQTETTVATTTTYTYNSDGRVTAIVSETLDTAVSAGYQSETHLWFYNEKGGPTKMLKVKNGKDTTQVMFAYDEKGHVAEEKWIKNGQLKEHYYYYYSDIGLLTDVVRFNSRAKKLLPDFIYEYDDEGKITKMNQSIKDGLDYLVWVYTYNDDGLKLTETCFNKHKMLEGKVVYTYTK